MLLLQRFSLQINAVRSDGVARVQEQIGVFPVGRVAELGEVAMDGIRAGDWYVTWPSLFRPLQLVACLAPGVLDWACRALYGTRKGARPPLGKRIMEATGMKRLFPEALRRNPAIKTEDEEYCDGEEGYGAADDAAAAYLLQCRKGLRAAHTYIRCIFSLSDSIL